METTTDRTTTPTTTRTTTARPPSGAGMDDRPGIWVGYGKLLKLLRQRAGLTQPELAEAISYSHALVTAVETARRPAKAAFTQAVENALNAGGVLAALQEQVDLAKLPEFFKDFAIIEAEVISRCSYDPLLVPGLLQTEDYARAVLLGRCPPLAEELVEQHVEARLSRQRLLDRKPVAHCSFILSEAVLLHRIGGAEVTRAQLRHLLDVGARRNVEIQVIPLRRDFHPGLDGPMVLVETDEHRQVGYVESQEIGQVVTAPEVVSAFALRCGTLRSQALNASESARLIERQAGEV